MKEQPTGEESPVQHMQGQSLRREREARGWSQAELASRVGVSTKTVKRWEGNQVSPHPYAGRRLCTLLTKSREELALGKLTEEPTKAPAAPGKQSDARSSAQSRRVVLGATIGVIFVGILAGAIRSSVLWPQASVSSLTPLPPVWHQLIRQSAPTCQDVAGTTWYVHKKGTSVSCQQSGMVIQQVSNYYAEADLLHVNGRTYSQSTFRVQVEVVFQKVEDGTTFAALLVQTPKAANAIGGYIFALNPMGYWQLQNVQSSAQIPRVKDGNVTINPAQPTTLTVEVRNGTLRGAIDGHWVVSYPDQLQPSSGAVGLMVEQSGNSSSPVRFSNFELDQ